MSLKVLDMDSSFALLAQSASFFWCGFSCLELSASIIYWWIILVTFVSFVLSSSLMMEFKGVKLRSSCLNTSIWSSSRFVLLKIITFFELLNSTLSNVYVRVWLTSHTSSGDGIPNGNWVGELAEPVNSNSNNYYFSYFALHVPRSFVPEWLDHLVLALIKAFKVSEIQMP